MNKQLLEKYNIRIETGFVYCTGVNMLKLFYDHGQKTQLYSEFINYFGSIELLNNYIKKAYEPWIVEITNSFSLKNNLFEIFNSCLDWASFHEINKYSSTMEDFYYSEELRKANNGITFKEFFKSITYDLIYSDE